MVTTMHEADDELAVPLDSLLASAGRVAGSQLVPGREALSFLRALARRPRSLSDRLVQLGVEYAGIVAGTSQAAPSGRDRRAREVLDQARAGTTSALIDRARAEAAMQASSRRGYGHLFVVGCGTPASWRRSGPDRHVSGRQGLLEGSPRGVGVGSLTKGCEEQLIVGPWKP